MTGGKSVDWDALIGPLVHPTKVLIIEAMLWIGRPLSASEFEQIFEERRGLKLSGVSYHIKSLAEIGVLKLVKKQRAGCGAEILFLQGRQTDPLAEAER